MDDLIRYVLDHTERGECQCGRCIDKDKDREPNSHSIDVHFFWVSLRNNPEREQFCNLVEEHYPGMDRLIEGPSYIELGGALGDQSLALRFLGMGQLMSIWEVMTPKSLGFSEPEASEMAGQGFVMCSGYKR